MTVLFTIPPERAFLDDLAEGLWREAEGDIFKLSEGLILLPTRRSCRHLREAFLRRIGKAALLPRMQPLGDIDEEELYFAENALNRDILPAITPLRRQLLLTQLVHKRNAEMPLDQASQLASALALFLDQAQIEQCDFGKLATLVEKKDLAEHWKQTVKFLEILTENWPKLLAAEGCIDPAERRNRLIKAQADAWRKTPPSYPVIAAGSTGTMPAVRELLGVIAALPRGFVILPGLDQALDDDAWGQVDATHPQYNMKELLKALKVERHDVKIWDGNPHELSPRARLLQEAMRPAEATAGWRDLNAKDIPASSCNGLARLDLDHPQEEAQTIALLMREALETPGKTTALVTPDRMLAERVSAMLMRWGVNANDSGGASLASQPIGTFLIDALNAASPHASHVDTLSLLKHPYAACGLDPAECRARVREVEIKTFRAEKPETSEWLNELRRRFRPLTATWDKQLPLLERIEVHIALAEKLAASDKKGGAENLWQGDAGEDASTWLDDWKAAAKGFPPLTGEEYQGLFANLLRGVTVRPSYGQHPRLSILGPLEARLIKADRIILGGLNEGVWPPEAPVDPWMSRPMKKEFGLPSPERRIGLSAHDFVQLASGSEVFLTRSRRAGNAPTVPSRFLLQLNTVLHALGHSDHQRDALAPKQPWAEWARQLDEPLSPPKPCDPPEPRPPVSARPKGLWVTQIGTWRRNPYAIYAARILNLKKLLPLDVEVDAADRGTIIHEALDSFMKAYPDALPPDALERLLAIGDNLFAVFEEYPEVKAFWWPRFERIAAWFIATEHERRAEGIRLVQAEAQGVTVINGFTLEGRADRIDRMPDGRLAIIDYKTGGVPTKAQVTAGYEPQLPLLAVIAARGGFKGIPAGDVGPLSYWQLKGGREGGEDKPMANPADDLAEKAEKGLEELITAYGDEKTPYRAVPRPSLMPRYDDYAHLARLAEWGRTAEDEWSGE